MTLRNTLLMALLCAAASPGETFGPGVHLVGSGIKPGLYRAKSAGSSSCYWQRLSGLDGRTSSILANGLKGPIDGNAMVEIKASDYAFDSQGCTEWTRVDSAASTVRYNEDPIPSDPMPSDPIARELDLGYEFHPDPHPACPTLWEGMNLSTLKLVYNVWLDKYLAWTRSVTTKWDAVFDKISQDYTNGVTTETEWKAAYFKALQDYKEWAKKYQPDYGAAIDECRQKFRSKIKEIQ